MKSDKVCKIKESERLDVVEEVRSDQEGDGVLTIGNLTCARPKEKGDGENHSNQQEANRYKNKIAPFSP